MAIFSSTGSHKSGIGPTTFGRSGASSCEPTLQSATSRRVCICGCGNQRWGAIGLVELVPNNGCITQISCGCPRVTDRPEPRRILISVEYPKSSVEVQQNSLLHHETLSSCGSERSSCSVLFLSGSWTFTIQSVYCREVIMARI